MNRTHCKYGHKFTPENTLPRRRGDVIRGILCRTCLRENKRRYLMRYPRTGRKRQSPPPPVQTPSGCLEWAGCRDRDGYGRRGNKQAHRVAYEAAFGPIPPGMFVCHSCDNPPCVNPAHLWLGDNRANQHDAARKGRQRRQSETHCVNGHEYTPENTYWRPSKVASRDCRACIRVRAAKYKVRRAA